MKATEAHSKKITISIPADLFAWGAQERAKQDITRSAFVASLYRQHLDELAEQERIERYAAAYSRQPETAEEQVWADESAAILGRIDLIE